MRARDLSRRRRKTRGRARARVLKMTARRARGVIKHQGKGGDFGVGTKGKTRTEKAWGHGVQICPSRGSTLTFSAYYLILVGSFYAPWQTPSPTNKSKALWPTTEHLRITSQITCARLRPVHGGRCLNGVALLALAWIGLCIIV